MAMELILQKEMVYQVYTFFLSKKKSIYIFFLYTKYIHFLTKEYIHFSSIRMLQKSKIDSIHMSNYGYLKEKRVNGFHQQKKKM